MVEAWRLPPARDLRVEVLKETVLSQSRFWPGTREVREPRESRLMLLMAWTVPPVQEKWVAPMVEKVMDPLEKLTAGGAATLPRASMGPLMVSCPPLTLSAAPE